MGSLKLRKINQTAKIGHIWFLIHNNFVNHSHKIRDGNSERFTNKKLCERVEIPGNF